MKAVDMEEARDRRTMKRNLRHVRSIRSSKHYAEKIKPIGDSTLVSAIRWIGHKALCRIIKDGENKNHHDVLDAIAKQYSFVNGAA